MFSSPNVADFLANEFARLGGGRFSLRGIAPRPLDGLFLWHDSLLSKCTPQQSIISFPVFATVRFVASLAFPFDSRRQSAILCPPIGIMAKLTVDNLDVRGKRVFVRVDFNVPMEEQNGRMTLTDVTRIKET